LSSDLLRMTIRSILLEAEDGLEAHILSFYEAVDMTIGELREVFTAALGGSLEDIQEKMDGQALVFTVIDGSVRGFSKGTSWANVQQGGKTIEDFDRQYADRPTVRDAYVKSMTALQKIVDANPELAQRLFQDGKVVIETAMLVPENPNTIPYLKHHVRFIRPEALGPGAQVDQAAYQQFLGTATSALERAGIDIQVGAVPILKPKAGDESAVGIDTLNRMLDELISPLGLTDDSTILDVVMGLTSQKLKGLGLSGEALEAGTKRLVAKWVVDEYKKLIPDAPDARMLKKMGIWDLISGIEKPEPFVDEAIIPLERVIQKMGQLLFRNLDFVLASNDTADAERLRSQVRSVRQMFSAGEIMTDPKKAERIRVALSRIGDDVDMFEKAVEGVVFRWKGKLRKITGMFTAINKLRGFFAYTQDPALKGLFDREPQQKNMTNESRRPWLNNKKVWVV
jgi:hypothetical protein